MTQHPQPRRFYVESVAADLAILPPPEAHHALNVLRLGVGAEVELFDGRGGLAAGRIAEAGRSRVAVRVACRRPARPRPAPAVHLAFATPKGQRLDWLLEKAAELGAATLQPVAFARSVAGAEAGQLSPAKRQRWLGHCIAAAKQSGQDWLPEIRDPLALDDFLAQELASPEGYLGVVGVVNGAGRPLRQILADCPAGRDVCLLVGPEGGITRGEMVSIVQAGFVPARLGRTVLRIETAAIALLAATVAMRERADAG